MWALNFGFESHSDVVFGEFKDGGKLCVRFVIFHEIYTEGF